MSREMKHSGIPWIGEIPKEWSIGKLKHFYRFITGFTPDSKNESFYDESGMPWVTISDMDGKFVTGTKNGISSNYISIKNPTIVPSNSLLYSFKLSVGQVARTKFDVYTNEAIASFLPSDNISLDYLFYSSQVCIIENANENIYGAKLLNQDLINNATIIFPPLSEQQKIASFLDEKCSEIDEMVVLQEKIIEELKAYKQSVITEAVTKGLNPDVPMKDSGIEWIGEIPENWEVKRLKNVFRLKTGTTPDGYDVMGEGDKISWFTPSDISDECNELYGSERSLLKSAVGDVELFPLGSIMFVGIGASAGKLGYAQIEGYSNQQITALIPNGVNGKYFYYFLIADKRRLKDNAFFTTLPIINNGYLSQNKVICPPSSAQNKVVEYLDNKCTEIDNLISIKQSKIESLKEYKKSIIYEYVTGKKEVE